MAFLCSVNLVSIVSDVCHMFCFEQSLHGIMLIASVVSWNVDLSLCGVKYDLSFCVGLWTTIILNSQRSLAVISDVPFMYGNVMVFTILSGF